MTIQWMVLLALMLAVLSINRVNQQSLQRNYGTETSSVRQNYLQATVIADRLLAAHEALKAYVEDGGAAGDVDPTLIISYFPPSYVQTNTGIASHHVSAEEVLTWVSAVGADTSMGALLEALQDASPGEFGVATANTSSGNLEFGRTGDVHSIPVSATIPDGSIVLITRY